VVEVVLSGVRKETESDGVTVVLVGLEVEIEVEAFVFAESSAAFSHEDVKLFFTFSLLAGFFCTLQPKPSGH